MDLYLIEWLLGVTPTVVFVGFISFAIFLIEPIAKMMTRSGREAHFHLLDMKDGWVRLPLNVFKRKRSAVFFSIFMLSIIFVITSNTLYGMKLQSLLRCEGGQSQLLNSQGIVIQSDLSTLGYHLERNRAPSRDEINAERGWLMCKGEKIELGYIRPSSNNNQYLLLSDH
ncbi:hypothetical protein [Marinomonas mediterranea]|jgi:hypothetical protein|uniref:Uncharacterized protein n=1 Tax=Marinomonas mediterranea (strain ATCC 700492 / JCM 21426 / NBRC 103028 / MMB-1) TaxID=717774 RepID=F2JWW4_MARM1|nr:hypothetical protein [Marinomonas mediterranea]ADZ92981.1 hypothetical protein Marme_3771 [Marinomonas mediterranea MMB-1]WCN19000.1 hypothetical protein GV053_19120 [Marinomonas mediterranea MMB-1]